MKANTEKYVFAEFEDQKEKLKAQINAQQSMVLSRKTLDSKIVFTEDSDSDIPSEVKRKSFSYFEMADILE